MIVYERGMTQATLRGMTRPQWLWYLPWFETGLKWSALATSAASKRRRSREDALVGAVARVSRSIEELADSVYGLAEAGQRCEAAFDELGVALAGISPPPWHRRLFVAVRDFGVTSRRSLRFSVWPKR